MNFESFSVENQENENNESIYIEDVRALYEAIMPDNPTQESLKQTTGFAVERSDGTIDYGWRLGPIDEEEGRILILKDSVDKYGKPKHQNKNPKFDDFGRWQKEEVARTKIDITKRMKENNPNKPTNPAFVRHDAIASMESRGLKGEELYTFLDTFVESKKSNQ